MKAGAYGLSFSLLGKGYMVSGRNIEKVIFKDVWCYDPLEDLWTQKNDYPYSFSVDMRRNNRDKAYVLDYTGDFMNTIQCRLLEISFNFSSWSRPDLTGFGLGGNVYFGTGNGTTAESGYYNDFWKYDVSQNEWTQIDNFPGVGRSTAFSFVIGDHAYRGIGIFRRRLHQFIRMFIAIVQKQESGSKSLIFRRSIC